jgi:hypothetical protein
VFDYEVAAREVLPKIAYDYYRSGANDEITLHENHSAYERIKLKPRVLKDISKRDLKNRFRLPEGLSIKNLMPAGREEFPKEVADSGLAAYVSCNLIKHFAGKMSSGFAQKHRTLAQFF